MPSTPPLSPFEVGSSFYKFFFSGFLHYQKSEPALVMDPGSDPRPYPLHETNLHPPPAVKQSLRLILVPLLVLLAAAGHINSERAPRSVPDVRMPVNRAAPAVASYPWNDAMLGWQRTAFHFQPPKNWINDPNAPLYHKGWYHLFYQYNPAGVVWGVGNLSWGHAVSSDLIHWLHLPLAMVPDRWYDVNGVWSGSATKIIPGNGDILITYTGNLRNHTQVQNLAVPADPSDPLLLNWIKSDANPVIWPPPFIGPEEFRDPSTAWFVPAHQAWRFAVASISGSGSGIAFVCETKDFLSYNLLPGLLHEVANSGLWECVDFYPVSTRSASVGLDTSVGPGDGVKHVLKVSMYDDQKDYYAIGEYDVEGNVWVPDEPENDVGMGLMLDYGTFYASKTFYDEVKKRRVMLAWANETDSRTTDWIKGWASLHTIPRTVVYDIKTGRNLLLWPVEEVESLRRGGREFNGIHLAPGSVIPLPVDEAHQLDITAEFEIQTLPELAENVGAGFGYTCNKSGGAADRSTLGPFGLLVLADDDRTEQTAAYFYVGRGSDGGLRTFFCHDELRSSEANDVAKKVYGSTVPVLDGENLTVRILVDHSIVESFAQGGRTCVTSRVYPTKAIYGAARVFLFNNATGAAVRAKSIKIWKMDSAFIRPYADGGRAQA